MLNKLWWDFGIEFLGEPTGDPVALDGLGGTNGYAIPYPNLLENVLNVSKYEAYTMRELIRMVFAREDFFLSESIPNTQYPLVAALDTTVGYEDIAPVVVTVPPLAGVTTSCVKFIVNKFCGTYNKVSFTIYSEVDTTLNVIFEGDQSSEQVSVDIIKEAWSTVAVSIPTNLLTQTLVAVKLYPAEKPSEAYRFKIGRVSLHITKDQIMAPQLRS